MKRTSAAAENTRRRRMAAGPASQSTNISINNDASVKNTNTNTNTNTAKAAGGSASAKSGATASGPMAVKAQGGSVRKKTTTMSISKPEQGEDKPKRMRKDGAVILRTTRAEAKKRMRLAADKNKKTIGKNKSKAGMSKEAGNESRLDKLRESLSQQRMNRMMRSTKAGEPRDTAKMKKMAAKRIKPGTFRRKPMTMGMTMGMTASMGMKMNMMRNS